MWKTDKVQSSSPGDAWPSLTTQEVRVTYVLCSAQGDCAVCSYTC